MTDEELIEKIETTCKELNVLLDHATDSIIEFDLSIIDVTEARDSLTRKMISFENARKIRYL